MEPELLHKVLMVVMDSLMAQLLLHPVVAVELVQMAVLQIQLQVELAVMVYLHQLRDLL